MDPKKASDPIPVATGQGEPAQLRTGAGKLVGKNTRPQSTASTEQAAFRDELVEQVMAMARFLLTNENRDPIGEVAKTVLGALDRGDEPALEDLIAGHNELKVMVAPATPGALAAKSARLTGKNIGRFLGPNAVVRNLALCNLFFLLAFLGISLSSQINEQTIDLSIYQQSGFPLLLKLCFLISAAGLGASFGALFDLWDEIKTNRFDPSGESVHWMKISLGIVAGIALTEIVQATASTPDGQNASAALIALIGGFSAGLLHVALSRMVNAIKSIFAPPGNP